MVAIPPAGIVLQCPQAYPLPVTTMSDNTNTCLVERVEGVDTVEVDQAAKQVVVRGRFADADVRAAIDEAGYKAA